MKRTPMATALCTRCAERTRAMQLVCMCASILAPYFSQNFCVWKDMRCKYGSAEESFLQEDRQDEH